MCTVTLTALAGGDSGFVLTSNRDEAVARKTFPPAEYSENGTRLLFPKDAVAGGTWIGLSKKKRALCLLNGAFEKHRRKKEYGKSRGVVVKELLATADLFKAIENNRLDEVEPFTCIIVDWASKLRFFEFVWDGANKHFTQLALKSYIWASSFLFSSEVRQERKRQFEQLQEGQELTADVLLNFHTSEEKEGMILDHGSLKTCSVTQIVKTPEGAQMFYRDLLQEGHPEYRKLLTM